MSEDTQTVEPKRYDDDKLFRFHWRHAAAQASYGRDVADAFGRLGYGGGAIRALDWYEEVGAVPVSEQP